MWADFSGEPYQKDTLDRLFHQVEPSVQILNVFLILHTTGCEWLMIAVLTGG
jgi:hypothetical protein